MKNNYYLKDLIISILSNTKLIRKGKRAESQQKIGNKKDIRIGKNNNEKTKEQKTFQKISSTNHKNLESFASFTKYL